MKAILFARVSSKEQEDSGYSLASQQKLLKDYADKNSFTIAKRFSISESARGVKQRKMFMEMLDYTKKNDADIIVCEKVDRLTRNMKDAGLVDDWIKEDGKREVHFVKENFILNKNTRAHENFVWDMKVATARFYSNNLSEEVKKGQKEKIAQGYLPMRAKIGYVCSGDKGHIIHIVDNNKAPLIKKMFELYAGEEHSLSTLTEAMKKEGLRNEKGKPVSRTRMHELLSDPFYCGINVWKGERYENAKQQPIVSKELFNSAQQKLGAKFGGHPKYRKHLPVFKAKIKCEECGGTITWELQKGHWYGHCNHYKNCSQSNYIRQEKVEEQLFPLFDKVAPKNEKIIEWLKNALKEHHEGEIDYNTQKREELNKVIKFADTRMEGAYRDKLDGRMPSQLCEKMIFDADVEKKGAIEALNKLGEARVAYYEAGYAIHELALHAKEIYQSEKATIEEKRLLLSQVFSNLTLKGENIQPNYTLAFDFLLNWMPKVNNNFEPAILQDKTDLLGSVCTLMRGRGDLNP